MALHSGGVHDRDGDLFGPPVNRLARLLSRCPAGGVLVSEATAGLLGDGMPEGVGLRELGRVELRDVGRSEVVYCLTAEHLGRGRRARSRRKYGSATGLVAGDRGRVGGPQRGDRRGGGCDRHVWGGVDRRGGWDGQDPSRARSRHCGGVRGRCVVVRSGRGDRTRCGAGRGAGGVRCAAVVGAFRDRVFGRAPVGAGRVGGVRQL